MRRLSYVHGRIHGEARRVREHPRAVDDLPGRTAMRDVTVSCSCGRKMTIDALRGRGAYRCGCGAGVLVELTDRPDARCAVADCRGEPKAQVPIVFLCDEHLDRLILGLMPQFYAKYPVHEWFRTVRKYEMEFGELPDSTFPRMAHATGSHGHHSPRHAP